MWGMLIVVSFLALGAWQFFNHGAAELFAHQTSPKYVDSVLILLGLWLVITRAIALIGKL